MNIVKKLLNESRLIFIRTIKFNLGISATISDEGDSEDESSEGVDSALMGNVCIGLCLMIYLYMTISNPPNFLVVMGGGVFFSVIWTLVMNDLFVFLRRFFGIQFPIGDHLYFPTEVFGKPFKKS